MGKIIQKIKEMTQTILFVAQGVQVIPVIWALGLAHKVLHWGENERKKQGVIAWGRIGANMGGFIMAIPWISLGLIGAGTFLIYIGQWAFGLALIVFIVFLNIVIQFIKGGGIDALRNR